MNAAIDERRQYQQKYRCSQHGLLIDATSALIDFASQSLIADKLILAMSVATVIRVVFSLHLLRTRYNCALTHRNELTAATATAAW